MSSLLDTASFSCSLYEDLFASLHRMGVTVTDTYTLYVPAPRDSPMLSTRSFIHHCEW